MNYYEGENNAKAHFNALSSQNIIFLTNDLKKAKILDLSILVEQKTLQTILSSMPSLSHLKLSMVFRNNPPYQPNYEISHQLIETLTTNYENNFNEMLMKDFLKIQNFPAFKKLRLFNLKSVSSSSYKNLMSILNQNFKNIEIIEI